jgi:hypothetical protein
MKGLIQQAMLEALTVSFLQSLVTVLSVAIASALLFWAGVREGQRTKAKPKIPTWVDGSDERGF